MNSKSSPPSLQSKVVLVTGGNRGIGLAIARALALHGCNVVISGRDESALKKAAKELGRKVVPIVCDVRDPEAVDKLFAMIRRRFRRLDILINNAGVAHENLSVAELQLQTWNDVIDTNLTGMFLVTQAALPLMKRGGAIVNNLSIAAKRVFPGSSAYNASKHAALGFTNTLREEQRKQGIRVIAVFAGATDTGIWKTLWPGAPRKQMILPSTVAQLVVDALTTSQDGMVEEVSILPRTGTL
jgi:NAD(P)-dependent dehydrogenase (short-subunit alcohol dehydrogenase family)